MSQSSGNFLLDTDWRDANVSTLPDWHPAFYEVEGEMQAVLQQFRAVMERYKQLLVDECTDPYKYLEAHIQEEVMRWMQIKMSEITSEIWKQ